MGVNWPRRFLAKMNPGASGKVAVPAGLESLYLHSPASEKFLRDGLLKWLIATESHQRNCVFSRDGEVGDSSPLYT